MKNLFLSILCLLVVAGCEEKKSTQVKLTAPDEVESQVQQMPEFHRFDSVKVGSRLYTYDILRQPTDSLPLVKDEMGDEAKDNTIRLILTRDGHTYFGHTFTKQTFQSSIEEDFYARSILDGIRFVEAEAGRGLTFFFSVSEPGTDMTLPFSLTVSDDGSFSFVKTEVMDMEE